MSFLGQQEFSGLIPVQQPVVAAADGGMANKRDGYAAEAAFVLAAIRRGYGVFGSVTHDQPVDIVLTKVPFRPVAVQVKLARWDGKLNRYSCFIGTNRGSKTKRGASQKKFRLYKKGEFDIFAIYFRETDRFRFWPLAAIVGKREVYAHSATDGTENWDIIDAVFAL